VGAKGFTLIELVVIMIITAVIATVVMARWNLDPVKRSSTVRKVVADVRYTQKLAVTTQRRAGLAFNANGYSVFSDISVAAAALSPGDPCSTDAANAFIVDFTQARCREYSGVTIAPAVTIAFDPMGMPVDAGGNALATQNITLTLGGASVITVEAGTGRVSY
jgi:Tfp pilus assembly protein FimT